MVNGNAPSFVTEAPNIDALLVDTPESLDLDAPNIDFGVVCTIPFPNIE